MHDDLGQVGSTNPRAHFAANKAAPGGWATACIGVIVLMRTNADKTKISGGGGRHPTKMQRGAGRKLT